MKHIVCVRKLKKMHSHVTFYCRNEELPLSIKNKYKLYLNIVRIFIKLQKIFKQSKYEIHDNDSDKLKYFSILPFLGYDICNKNKMRHIIYLQNITNKNLWQ